MKKTIIHIILIFPLIISCNNINKSNSDTFSGDNRTKKIETQKSIGTENNLKVKDKKKIDTVENDNQNISKLIPTTNNFNFEQSALKFEFSKINKNDYQSFKENYINKIVIDSSQFKVMDSSLILTTDKKNIELKSLLEDRIYYEGYIQSINSYVLTNCNIHYCSTYLLNKKSTETILIYSPFDTELYQPLISKDKNQILFFSNSMDRKSFISRYTKNEITGEFDFNKLDSFYTEDWGINEIVWINDNAIALKVSDNKNKDLYLKAIIE